MTWGLVLGAALAVACVVFVALPFLREPETRDDRLAGTDAAAKRRLDLLEARDRALAALKELEFDHRTGKVSDEDYRAQVGELRRRAALALAALAPAGKVETAPNGEREGMSQRFETPQPSEQPQPAVIPEPMPPPDEGTPPQPAIIPEPFPPPGEADRPQQPNIPEPFPGGPDQSGR